ncbi:MAG: hypothetical protein ICV76_03710 [Nitrospiraceae bacterium]|nr:hypothetical protein [Nitrospiraceae bacterium]
MPKTIVAVVVLLAAQSVVVFSEESAGLRPLIETDQNLWRKGLADGTLLLDHAVAIEMFLDRVEGSPPDWPTVYGDGPGHDERLFALNRERDGRRDQRDVPEQRLTFVWSGQLSDYDVDSGGFRVALGPTFVSTRWGVVRFKPDDLPANLIAVPSSASRESLRQRVAGGERIDIDVAMTGRLIPEESIIYDFSHDEPGRGLVMPVVRVEKIEYRLGERTLPE